MYKEKITVLKVNDINTSKDLFILQKKINAANSIQLDFKPNAVVNLVNINFVNKQEVIINGNGATLIIPQGLAFTEYNHVFLFENISKVILNDFTIEGNDDGNQDYIRFPMRALNKTPNEFKTYLKAKGEKFKKGKIDKYTREDYEIKIM